MTHLPKEIEIYNKWFKSESDHTQANILNAILDGLKGESSPGVQEAENQKQWFVKNAMAILGAEVHLLIRDGKLFDFDLIEKWLYTNYPSESPSPSEQPYWKRRCEAAELILKKYYKNIPDCPEYMDWQSIVGGSQPLPPPPNS